MNVFTATGRLGRDAETRFTTNQTPVASMPIAVDFGFGDNKGTIWMDSSLWGKRAESGLIGYLVKGQQVAVSGELGQRKYTNKEGAEVTVTTLKIAEIDLVGGQPSGQQQQPQQQRPAPQPQPRPQAAPEEDFDSSDIPF